jgi:hypothetical protein
LSGQQFWQALSYLRRPPGSGSAFSVPFDPWPVGAGSVSCPEEARGEGEWSAKLKLSPARTLMSFDNQPDPETASFLAFFAHWLPGLIVKTH